MPNITVQKFIAKWEKTKLKERSSAQEHFIDLCQLLGHETPAEADPEGTWFTFEYGAQKTTGSSGFADVWKKGFFGWEYKRKHKDLQAAYAQLQQYAPALANPPLLIVCDTDKFIIHTNWNDLVSEEHEFSLHDLNDPDKLNLLRYAFFEPDKLKPTKSRQQLTEEVAGKFAEISEKLRQRKNEPHSVAHFVNRLIFCMFAEDIGLLPKGLFTSLLERCVKNPDDLQRKLSSLFLAMKDGKSWGADDILWFNGGLFDNDAALILKQDEIKLIYETSQKDWSDIDPSIMGTLFERGLDPEKRSQLGAHYTDRDKIMKIINPVIVLPFEHEWDEVKKDIDKEFTKADEYAKKANTSENARQKSAAENRASKTYKEFLAKIRSFKVLDPACGSGNFLYLSLKALKDIELQVSIYGEVKFSLSKDMPEVGPENIFGIEISPYAVELARVSVWIGEIQWLKKHGFNVPANPVLRKLENIACHDALISDNGEEYQWPAVDAIVGNPPFIGGKKLKPELGDDYVAQLRHAYKDRLPDGADFVCFWFEKANQYLKQNRAKRVGLVSTNSINGGANRVVLDEIAQHNIIYNVWPDEPWINAGAAVRVAMTCFRHKDISGDIALNDNKVDQIFSTLTAKVGEVGVDLSKALPLVACKDISFQGIVPRSEINKKDKEKASLPDASFLIEGPKAREMLLLPENPNGQSNADVLRPYYIGDDISSRPQDRFIVDFYGLSESEAALYEAPFKYIQSVRVHRAAMNQPEALERWWLHWNERSTLRKKIGKLKRYIATPRNSKHRPFVWLPTTILPDCQIVAVAKDDDASFGVLNSKFHELWTLRMCTYLGVGNTPRYTPKSTFETFPFPKGMEPNVSAKDLENNSKAKKIATVAIRLSELRDNWLNPAGSIKRLPEVIKGLPERIIPADKAAEKILSKRTLNNLYNENPVWLQNVHNELDCAVAEAYGWPTGMSDDQIVEKLFLLNQQRSKASE